MQMTQMSVQDAIQNWPKDHQDKANQLIDKYGQPQEITDNHLTWWGNAPWKRTTIYKQSIQHDFPMPHKDYLKQTIDYKVPPEKACEIEKFDGSVLIDRTGGELHARCDTEAANFASINLVDKIVTSGLSVQEAKQHKGQAMMQAMQGQMTPLTQGFQFDVPKGGTADPDTGMGGM